MKSVDQTMVQEKQDAYRVTRQISSATKTPILYYEPHCLRISRTKRN